MRALKFLVVAIGVLIVAGTVTLVVLLVQRAGGGRGGEAARVALDLPAGTQIVSVAGAEGRFAVHIRGPGGDRVLFLDARTGRVVGELSPGAAVPLR